MRRLMMMLLMVLLAGCSELPLPQGLPFLATPDPTPAASPTPSPATPTAQAAPEVSPTAGPVTLQVWLPPAFDPSANTTAGNLLEARLEEFKARRPDVRVQVRIKAADGPGGLLDSLTTASAAAPLALPDLVALPRPLLEVAALKGLLHTYGEASQATEDPDWYEYARQSGRLQNSNFGLPFAGDALLLVYRPEGIPTPPRDFASLTQATTPLAFPAADPQALFTLSLYQSAGGAIQDEAGRPILVAEPLQSVLAVYQSGARSEILPIWITQFGSDEQAWNAFEEKRAGMVVTWVSRYLSTRPVDASAAPIPTSDGTPFTLATSWVWALSGTRPERQALSIELAEFLTESQFLAEWTRSAGYLPPRPSALDGWGDASLQAILNEISLSARLYPAADILNSLGPPLEGAVQPVLKQQIDPAAAAQQAVGSLSSP